MESFKAVEKETKTKQYSKVGLSESWYDDRGGSSRRRSMWLDQGSLLLKVDR